MGVADPAAAAYLLLKTLTSATESPGFVLVQELTLKPKIKQTTLHTLIILITKFIEEMKH